VRGSLIVAVRAALLLLLLIQASVAHPRAQAPVSHARMLFDQGHHNLFAGLSGSYRSFAGIVRDAGFVLTPNISPFSLPLLETADVVVIANPNGAGADAPVDQRTAAAFAPAEVDALHEWVESGGALLLVTDHYPTGVAAASLAGRFGIQLSGGWTDDPANRRSVPGYGAVFGYLMFSRQAGLIGDHPITDGSDPTERIGAVATTTGESIEGPSSSTALLRLSPTARDWLPKTGLRRDAATNGPRDFNPCPACAERSAGGRSQAIALEFGRGRVVVVGEMGVLTDYSLRDADNRQFALNIVRWLARAL
jgi:hypothetical protein